MRIPEYIQIGQSIISTLWIFVFMGFVYFLFIIWYEGKKDGFENEKLLDLAMSQAIFGLISYFFNYNLYQRLRIISYNSPLLQFDEHAFYLTLVLMGLIAINVVYCRTNRWSIYRILDILSISTAGFLSILSLGGFFVFGDNRFLFPLILFPIYYIFVLRNRGSRLFSGLSFSTFLLVFILLGIVFFKNKANLILYFPLFTISLANLYFRKKRLMLKSYLPTNFINKIKNRLLKKDKELSKQEMLLKEQDAYMQPGRTTDNAEIIDEAILEDSRKEVTDAVMKGITNLRIQINRALSFIKIGKYGICEVCGEKIDKARLNFYPEATKCVKCASAEDEKS